MRLLLSASLLAALSLSVVRADEALPEQPVSVATLLKQATDFSTLPLHRNWRTNLVSSCDPTGGNDDCQKFVSLTGDHAVLADLKGPGAVVRFWTTAVYKNAAGNLTADPSGQVKIYIDDNPTPVIDEPFKDLFDKNAPFTKPLTDHYGPATISYFPIPYAKHCLITLDKPQGQFYQIQSIAFPEGTKVRPFALPLTAEDQAALDAAGKIWTTAAQLAPPTPTMMPVGAPLKPGAIDENLTTNAIKAGPGVITRFWVLTGANNLQLRNLVLRAWFDGHRAPDIEAPVADFFGNAYGQKEFNSFFLSNNGSLNCFFSMPFKQSARFAIENRNHEPVQVAFGWDIKPRDFTPGTEYFHADFNQEITQNGHAHAWLKVAKQAGHFVGVVQTMQSGHTLGYCEGDDQVRVDDQTWLPSKVPSTVVGPWNGTGTEDCFNSAWYFGDGLVSRPMNGTLVREDLGRIDTFRFFVNDAPVWQDSIDAQIEIGGTNEGPGIYYSSVAYWYGAGERVPMQPFPDAAHLALPPDKFSESDPRATVIEGESLISSAKASAGSVEKQEMPGLLNVWSDGAQLAWTGAKKGDTLDLTFTAPVAGEYNLTAYIGRGADYGAYNFSVEGKPLPWNANNYEREEMNVRQDMGTVTLPAGPCHLLVKQLDTDAASKGTRFGLDFIVLHLQKEAGKP